jgi:uncharacterized protein (DUF1697 family)
LRYVAFLRGINVGGHKPLKMADLRMGFEGLGFQNVRTVLASGNVVFDAAAVGAAPDGAGASFADGAPPSAGATNELAALRASIEAGLNRVFGYPVGVAVRRVADLERLVASDPFKGVAITPESRLYVTFFAHPVENGTRISPERRESDLRIVRVTPGEVLSAITLSQRWGTTQLMAHLEKEFGPGVTTRNWNTVVKIVGGLQPLAPPGSMVEKRSLPGIRSL